MVKKLALTSLFFSGNDVASLSSAPSVSAYSSTGTSWQWPSCTQARTLSFSRDDGCRSTEISSMISSMRHKHEDYKTSVMNPAYSFLDTAEQSCLSNSSAASGVDMSGTGSVSMASEPAVTLEVDEQVIIRGLRSSNDRLFFEPEATSSIVKLAATAGAAAFGGATALAIDTADPYGDFRRSMEEMVMSHGATTDWGWLEEMLGWYLKANGKKTHGLIVGAFVDLLVALTSAPSPTSSCSSFVKKGKKIVEC